MVVDQVALLLSELELGNKASNSELLNDVEDVELGVESCTGFRLKLVLVVIRMPAA